MDEPKGSYGRCLLKPGFIDRFYEIFIDSHPAIKPLFKNTDWKKQKDLLRKGVSMVILLEEDDPSAHRVLTRIGETHSPQNLNIDPTLYPYWKQSLLKTVSEFDSKYSSEVEQAWTRVIDAGIKYIVDHYK